MNLKAQNLVKMFFEFEDHVCAPLSSIRRRIGNSLFRLSQRCIPLYDARAVINKRFAD
jgi:hypothetical protein